MKVLYAYFSPVLQLLLAATLVGASLDAKIKAKGKRYLGNVLDYNTFEKKVVTDILEAEFGAITAEQSWKWDFVQRKPNEFDFELADKVAEWATTKNKLLRGHTLVWHSQLPAWVHAITDKDELTSVIKTHIEHVAGRYSGKVHSWDVVNEVLEINGKFRNTVFYRLLGEEFIDLAFRTAHAADPQGKLYINDYSLEHQGPKLDAMVALVERLKARGVPIHGIGTQSHLTSGKSKIAEEFEPALARLAETGLEVAITELDIRISQPVTEEKLVLQKAEYTNVTAACLRVPSCVGITIWGVSDRDSWVNPEYFEYEAPLLWDNDYSRKSAYEGVDEALN